MTCLMAGAVMLTLVAPAFSLHWTHSVEMVEWVEHWSVEPGGLVLTRAAVKGSGAGMEPGPGAVREGDWWVWAPDTRVPVLHLAASGATGAGWRLCDGATCHDLGAVPGAGVTLAPCAP
jgi:hypothetical protein